MHRVELRLADGTHHSIAEFAMARNEIPHTFEINGDRLRVLATSFNRQRSGREPEAILTVVVEPRA